MPRSVDKPDQRNSAHTTYQDDIGWYVIEDIGEPTYP